MALCGVMYGQTVTARFVDEPLGNVLKEIERQTRLSFIYKTDVVDEGRRVTAEFRRSPIKKVLEALTDDNTGFLVQKKLVVLYKKKTTAKNVPRPYHINVVRGRVADKNGVPVVGGSVFCRHTGQGTITDTDGRFSLNVPPGSVLAFSYIGFVKKDINVGRRSYIAVVMDEDQRELQEVVVIGYGAAMRKSIVGAVDQIKARNIEHEPDGSVASALQGKSASLVVQRRSFDPNAVSENINIRGISTVNSNAPLIVVDGIVYPDNSLDMLNTNDIDNISILKDAGAAAIYGSRSANGVLLVTTKKGRRGERAKVSLDIMAGLQTPNILYSPVPGYRNAELRNQSLADSELQNEFTTLQIQDLYDHRNEEKWFLRQIFRNAVQQSYNVAVSGGTTKSTYMVSVGYEGKQSNYVGNKDYGKERFLLRSNLTIQLGKLGVQTLLSYSRTNETSTTGTSLERDASRVPPYYYYKMKENGRYLLNDILSEFNPLGSLEAGGENKDRENNFTANVSAELSLLPELKLKAVVGADIMGRHRYMRQKMVSYYSSGYQSEPIRYDRTTRKSSDSNYDSYLINAQFLAEYNRTTGRHRYGALMGVTNESATTADNSITVVYSNADLGTSGGDDAYVKLGEGTKLSPEELTRTSILSLLGRFTYNYAERYYGEFDFRYDGSSKFAGNNRWGFFPSFSVGWLLTEESFMKPYRNLIGNMKLRGSYGILGNQTIGAYDRFTTYNLYDYTYSFNNKPVTGAGFSLGSENLKWERTHTYNVGIEADFFKRNVELVFDFFYKRTKDILIRPVTSSTFGTDQGMQNSGEITNRGWELTLKLHGRTCRVAHEFAVNMGDSFNRLEKFPEGEQLSRLEEMWILRRTGVSLNSYYGFKTDGMFQSEDEIRSSALPVGARVKPGDIRFVDRNGDGVIDSNDRFVLGNAFPRYTFGLSYTMTWKGMDMSLFMNGVGKRDMMVRGELVEPFCSNYSYVMYSHQLDFWTPQNTTAHYPRLSSPGSSSNSNNYRMGSDIYIFDGAYARLKNITIGYTLPKKWTQHVGMSKLRLYVTGHDLLTFSHNSFVDPESTEFDSRMSYSGANTGCNYPPLKYYGFGIEIEF